MFKLFPQEKPLFKNYHADENAKARVLFCNEVGKQMLQDFLDYNPEREEGTYAEGSTTSITWLDALVAAVVKFVVEWIIVEHITRKSTTTRSRESRSRHPKN